MRVLMPVALLSIVPVAVTATGPAFALAVAAFALYLLALVVTVAVEVPIATRIAGWTVETLPPDWAAQRDRWTRFHVVRVVGSVAGLTALTASALIS
ncbi:hypothetical protein GCM10009836_62070 [Pseudonocardia ailaonensis]|uniref:DUF1772 domain-containing protein n=1 Tax=Pseudonocardia ailaonensis TaxID=367279 RepID=A0ABN2NK83_9PSEU